MNTQRVVLGIDLGGHGIRGVLASEDGEQLDHRSIALASREQASVERELTAVIVDLERAASRRGLEPSGIGFGVPGFHRLTDGVLASSPNFPNWEGMRLRERLAGLTGRPVAIDNDANVAVLGESWCGVAAGCEHVVLLTLGTGVGSGILVGGRVLRGATGAGGEAGHMAVRRGGEPCGCGARGCLEAHASGTALARIAGMTSASEVCEAARRGDPPALEAVQGVGEDLGRALGDLGNLFNPQVLVVTGGLTRSWDLFEPSCDAGLRQRATPEVLRTIGPVRVGERGDTAGAVGAARLALGATGS